MNNKCWSRTKTSTKNHHNWSINTVFWWRSSPLLGYISLVQIPWLGPMYKLKCEKKLFTFTYSSWNMLQWVQNVQIYQKWLFLLSIWLKIAQDMVKTIFPSKLSLKLEKTLVRAANYGEQSNLADSTEFTTNLTSV